MSWPKGVAPLGVLLFRVLAPVEVTVPLPIVEGSPSQRGCQEGNGGGEGHGEAPPLLGGEESGGVADQHPPVGGRGGGEEAGEEGDRVGNGDPEGAVEGGGGAPVVEQAVGVQDDGDVGQPQEAVEPDEPVDGGRAALRPDHHQDGGDEGEDGEAAQHCQDTGEEHHGPLTTSHLQHQYRMIFHLSCDLDPKQDANYFLLLMILMILFNGGIEVLLFGIVLISLMAILGVRVLFSAPIYGILMVFLNWLHKLSRHINKNLQITKSYRLLKPPLLFSLP